METLYQRVGQERLHALIQHFYDLVFASEKIGPLFQHSDKDLVRRKQELFLEDKNLEKLVGDRMLLTKIVTFVLSKLLIHNYFSKLFH